MQKSGEITADEMKTRELIRMNFPSNFVVIMKYETPWMNEYKEYKSETLKMF